MILARSTATRTLGRPVMFALLCAVGALAYTIEASAQSANPTLDQYLDRIGIDAKERAVAARGEAVTKLLPTASNRDITVFGMIGVNVRGDTAVAHALDVERFLLGHSGALHRFSVPPSASDVREAAFAESEYRDLRKCRRDDCRFKLPVAAMQGFVDQIDWSSRDAKAQADARLRDGLLALVRDYSARGNAAMLTYDDVRGVRAGDVFTALLEQGADLYEYAPGLQRYLTDYPVALPDGARDFLYWSEDRIPRLRPTLTVNHVVGYEPPDRPGRVVFVARKQMYASHYFEGAFELLAIVNAGEQPGGPGAYILSVRRFRFDNLPGGLFNVRGRVRKQMVDQTRVDLERQRTSLEAVPGR
jgi:hypothetical protein